MHKRLLIFTQTHLVLLNSLAAHIHTVAQSLQAGSKPAEWRPTVLAGWPDRNSVEGTAAVDDVLAAFLPRLA